ncbi:hypothetical protein CEXT_285201 [Caerostris extrusa]|uniref:Uncharacterized protein n=1 Tax=Caerostris extrusa TaxID=172846 RepID=A0AAV4V8I0_CAEEX|nr:hypothetical protein CEXT_285201 [Caerostris extrusa]
MLINLFSGRHYNREPTGRYQLYPLLPSRAPGQHGSSNCSSYSWHHKCLELFQKQEQVNLFVKGLMMISINVGCSFCVFNRRKENRPMSQRAPVSDFPERGVLWREAQVTRRRGDRTCIGDCAPDRDLRSSVISEDLAKQSFLSRHLYEKVPTYADRLLAPKIHSYTKQIPGSHSLGFVDLEIRCLRRQWRVNSYFAFKKPCSALTAFVGCGSYAIIWQYDWPGGVLHSFQHIPDQVCGL